MSQADADGSPEKPLIICGKTINFEHVAKLAALGSSDKEMARFFEVSFEAWCQAKERCAALSSTIQKNYDETCRRLRRKQMELAESGDKTMLIWLGKNMLGQSDVNTAKLKADGISINVHVTPLDSSTTVNDKPAENNGDTERDRQQNTDADNP